MVTQPGFYPDMPDAEYHADPAPTPSLSSSLARTIVEKSVLHAKFASPRFGEREEFEPTAAMQFGSAAHALALGKGAEVIGLEFDDWRSKAAREAREAHEAQGKLVFKIKDYERLVAMTDVIRPVIADLVGDNARAEEAMFWQGRTGGWRRGKVDVMSSDRAIIVDYKTVTGSAEPESAGRSLYTSGYHIQQALYMRGLDALDPDNVGRRAFYFVVQEQNPPFAFSIHRLAGDGLSVADAQVDYAETTWDVSVTTGNWPAYGRIVNHTPIPAYLAQKWYGAALREEGERDISELLNEAG